MSREFEAKSSFYRISVQKILQVQGVHKKEKKRKLAVGIGCLQNTEFCENYKINISHGLLASRSAIQF